MNLRQHLRTFISGIACLSLWGACLIPGTIEERPVTVGALTVDLDLLNPSSQEPILWHDRADGPITFSVEGAISLPEESNAFFLWWVNYSEENSTPNQFINPSFVFDPCGDLQINGQKNDLFTVTVIISDKQAILEPDFRNYPEGTATYAIDWNVGLVGQCP